MKKKGKLVERDMRRIKDWKEGSWEGGWKEGRMGETFKKKEWGGGEDAEPT